MNELERDTWGTCKCAPHFAPVVGYTAAELVELELIPSPY